MSQTLNLSPVQIVYEDDTDEWITLPADAVIYDILTYVSPTHPNNYEVASYGISLANTIPVADIVNANPTPIFFISIQNNKNTTRRDEAYKDREEAIRMAVDVRMTEHWSTYNHHTTGLFSFTAEPLIRTTDNNRVYPTYSKVVDSVNLTRHKPQTFGDNKVEEMLYWDRSGGDCTTSHAQLKQILEEDKKTWEVKWTMRYANKLHTCLTGVAPNGTLFLLDVGVLKNCRTIGMSQRKTIIKASKEDKAAEFHVLVPEGTVYYKVQP